MNTRHHTLSRLSIPLSSWPISDQNGEQRVYVPILFLFKNRPEIETKSVTFTVKTVKAWSLSTAPPNFKTLIGNLEVENET